MSETSAVIKELLENGVHFGHQTNKWNPKMKQFIFGKKSGIYIIDLEKTEKALLEAANFLHDVASSGGRVLFVGTKKQAKQIIKEQAEKCGMFYVNERWLGGCLTNFETIRKSINRLRDIQKLKETEDFVSLTKKEKAHYDREEGKLRKYFDGIKDMVTLPSVLVVIDSDDEAIAVKEAKKMKIPVIALVDTNCDPDLIDFPIPGNDDAIRSIQYIVSTLVGQVEKGTNEFAASGKKTAQPARKEEKPEVKKETKAERPAPKRKPEAPKKPAVKEPEEQRPEEIVEKEAEGDVEGDINMKGAL